MTENEVADVLRAAADKLAGDVGAMLDGLMVRPPIADECAEYVLRHYTGVDWGRVSALRAEFKDHGATLAISVALVPDPECIIISLEQPEETSADSEAQRQVSRPE